MKKFFAFFMMLAVATVLSINLTSCSGEDPVPAPTVKLLADIDPNDQYTVILTVQATDAESYSWNYGNGETSTTVGNHNYTYAESGDYTISVTVTNESGTDNATANVTINPSIQEMLAGVDPAGKAWVISTTSQATDGVGPLAESELNVNLPVSLVGGDLLGYVGFPEEYDNEFIFKPDGSYEVDNVNGQNLCTQIMAVMATGEMEPGGTWTAGIFGFATMPWSVTGASWTVTEDATIEFEAMSEDPTSTETVPPLTPMNVKYEGVTQLTINNGYFGLLDLTNYVIIDNISADQMQVSVIIHTRDAKPSMFARMTFVPKS